MKRRLAWATAAIALGLTACSANVVTDVPSYVPVPVPTAAGNPAGTCADPTATLPRIEAMPAAGKMPTGTILGALAGRGRLIVGVVADHQPLGWRDPLSGDFQGFEVDLYRQLAKALTGDEKNVEVRVITANDAVAMLADHSVDVVLAGLAMTCGRWEHINLSAPYLETSQRLLTHKGKELTDLTGKRVCVVGGTPSADALTGAEVVAARTATDCLVALQRGNVEAISDSAEILAGLAQQDPFTQVMGGPLAEQSLAVGVAKDRPLLAQFVSGVVAQWVASGGWQASHDLWLTPLVGAATPPAPDHGRPQ